MLVQKTTFRKSSIQNGPRSTIILVALRDHSPDHARWGDKKVDEPHSNTVNQQNLAAIKFGGFATF